MKIARISFLAFIALAVTIGGLWPARQNIAQRFAKAELNAMGLGPVKLTIADLGFSGLTLSEFSLLGGELTAERLDVSFTPDGLMAGQVLEINIDRLHSKGEWTADGLSLPILQALPKGAEGKTPFKVPFEKLSLTQTTLELTTPQGPVLADVDITITNNIKSLAIKGRHAIEGSGIRGSGDFSLEFTAFNLAGLSGKMSQNLNLNGFIPPGQKKPIDGQGAFALAMKGPEATLTFTEPLVVSQGKNKATLQAAKSLSLSLGEKSLTIAAPRLNLKAVVEGTKVALNGALKAELDPTGTAGHKVSLKGDLIRLDDGTNTAILKTVRATYTAKPESIHMTIEGVEVPGVLDTAPPIRLALNIKPEGDLARFSGSAKGKNNPINLTFNGSHNIATGQGHAAVDLAALAFLPGGFQPADMMPRLIEFIQEAQGAISSSGTLSWTKKGLTPDIKVLMADLSFSHGFLGIKRANGVIAINGFPLTTPKGQQLAIAAIEAGAPLTDNHVSFHLAEGNILALEGGVLHFAGGDIKLRAANIPLNGAPVSMGLDVGGVNLTQLTALTELKGLSASGTLSGHLPATLAAGDLNIKNAVLRSAGPGILSYRPSTTVPTQAMGGSTVNIAWQALDNFHYTSLELGLDGRTSGEMTLALHISGANPDLYDGYPLELNIKVQGRLAEALSRSMEGYQIPKRIEEKMKNFTSKKNR